MKCAICPNQTRNWVIRKGTKEWTYPSYVAPICVSCAEKGLYDKDTFEVKYHINICPRCEWARRRDDFRGMFADGEDCPACKAIDDKVDEWHTGDYEMPLHEFLGMTNEEYGEWLRGGTK